MIRLFLLLQIVAFAQSPLFRSVNSGARATFSFVGRESPPASLLLTATANGRLYSLIRLPEIPPPLFPGLVEYLIPRDVPPGTATVEIPGTSDVKVLIEITTQPMDFIYRNLSGVAFAHQQQGIEPPRRNLLTDPAKPGDRITLWATGLAKASILIAGPIEPYRFEARVEHQSDGLDRIDFTLPEETAADCYLRVFVNGTLVTISTGALGMANCPHALGLTAPDLLRLDRGLTVPFAAIGLSPSAASIRYGELTAKSSPIYGYADASRPVPAGCDLARDRGIYFGLSVGPPPFDFVRRPAELIAPNGTVFATQGGPVGGYSFYPELAPRNEFAMWQSGPWIFRLPADPNSGAAASEDLNFSVPPLAQFKNSPDWTTFSVRRDFVFEWTPVTGSDTDGYVKFKLRFIPSDWTEGGPPVEINCTQPVSAGKLVVPSSLMRSVQPTEYIAMTATLSASWQPRVFKTPGNRYVTLSYGVDFSPLPHFFIFRASEDLDPGDPQ